MTRALAASTRGAADTAAAAIVKWAAAKIQQLLQLFARVVVPVRVLALVSLLFFPLACSYCYCFVVASRRRPLLASSSRVVSRPCARGGEAPTFRRARNALHGQPVNDPLAGRTARAAAADGQGFLPQSAISAHSQLHSSTTLARLPRPSTHCLPDEVLGPPGVVRRCAGPRKLLVASIHVWLFPTFNFPIWCVVLQGQTCEGGGWLHRRAEVAG